ncbi:peptide-methionine (S)-S-oxide reductase MsrA [Paracoccus laeviglucosivorans]|uniref:Peptide methionine sulfoxide reductase MsrA n=1 Tax=Paracoccus laeviglucosivorans TaxID=1197861 RepID=A0A521AV00_9RHOB|nr:peptide-methionine (S)-S-oxide reductase MsrA [Paracoccus laeviglucosivorans]SMO38682.1 peptide-methionine (S)-S-oxide reductase [Paracoccus laeviglucosivorans]
MNAVTHRIFDRPMDAPVPKGFETVIFGMGCYWGVERLFWQLDGVWMTEVGFAGGTVENPTYKQVCEGGTGHAEVVRVVFDPTRISFERLLQVFWENHNPTQGNRQGNDVGSQYRSVIMYATEHQKNAAELSKADYGNRLAVEGFRAITTEILPTAPFYPAHEDHQQYLDRYPDGYCGLRGTGVQAPLTDIAEEI